MNKTQAERVKTAYHAALKTLDTLASQLWLIDQRHASRTIDHTAGLIRAQALEHSQRQDHHPDPLKL